MCKTNIQGCSSIESGSQTSSSVPSDVRDLQNKLSLKNQAIQGLEAKIVTLETAEKAFKEQLTAAENAMQLAKIERERLRLKVSSRGAPYFQVI